MRQLSLGTGTAQGPARQAPTTALLQSTARSRTRAPLHLELCLFGLALLCSALVLRSLVLGLPHGLAAALLGFQGLQSDQEGKGGGRSLSAPA